MRETAEARLDAPYESAPGAQILIVHADARMRARLGRIMNRWWHAKAVGDRETALSTMRRQRPDLVVCEFAMPGLDGGALLSTVRADKHLHDVPMILISAWGIGESKAAAALLARLQAEIGAEQALRKRDSRLQAAAELIGLGSYYWDPQTNALEWDDRIRAMWGLPAGSPVDYATWRACVHVDDLERVEVAIRQCSDPEGDGVYEVEYRVIGRDDGVERWVWTRAQTRFEHGTAVGCYGVALDITERKGNELALERRLGRQTAQREVAEAALRQLQRLDAIGQITAGVAHDFSNLLATILINVGLLARMPRRSDEREALDLIRTAAERGAGLIAHLLSFSRKARLEPRPVDLNQRIAGMRRLLKVAVGTKVTLELQLLPQPPLVQADADQIETVLLNLAINARDAMPAGGILRIETFRTAIATVPVRPEEPLPGAYVGMAVIDNGAGIAPAALPHVFEPFFTTKEKGKGSGLGLPQVFAFAKQSQGGVRIDSRLGEGTRVTIFLPLASADA